MQVIVPVAVTDAILTSHNVAEPDAGETVWAPATTYAAGATVIRTQTHRIYRSLQASNVGNTPESSPTWWSDAGPTNRWAMFDTQVSTATVRNSPLVVELTLATRCNAIGLFGLVGASLLVEVLDGATLVYNRTVPLLDQQPPTDWWEYFYAPIVQRTAVVLNDLVPFGGARVKITLTAASGQVRCGALSIGLTRNLGDSLYGVSTGIKDYSVKNYDPLTEAISLSKKTFSKALSCRSQMPEGAIDGVVTVLEALRATPVVWLSTEDDRFESLNVFGFYEDFAVEFNHAGVAYCSLKIQGMN